MKKTFLFLVIFLTAAATVLAEWPDTFRKIYSARGLDEAVITALSKGYSADQVIRLSRSIDGLAEEKLVKALFCALVPLEVIHRAAKMNSIPEKKITTGYELALEECPDALEEKIKVSTPQQTAPPLSPGAGNSGFASPSNFR